MATRTAIRTVGEIRPDASPSGRQLGGGVGDGQYGGLRRFGRIVHGSSVM